MTNQRSGTVSVIDTETRPVIKTITAGTERADPDGRRLFVANSSSDDVSVVDTHADLVIRRVEGIGPKPSGVAVTGGPLGRSKVYVTQFLAQLRDDARSVEEKEGRDDGKEGRVTVISAASGRVLGVVSRNPPRRHRLQVERVGAGPDPAHESGHLYLRHGRLSEPPPHCG